MAAITLPKILEVTANSSYPVGSSVKIINRGTGDVMTRDLQNRRLTLNQNKKCVVVLDDLTNGWAANQVIEVVLSGIKYGSTTVTLDASSTKQTTSAIAAGSMTTPAWSV